MEFAFFKEILSAEGRGNVTFEDGRNVSVTFTAKMLPNGRFEGELVFPTDFITDFLKASSNNRVTLFDFEGASSLNEHEVPISMRRCFLTSFESSMGDTVSLKARFVAQEVIFQKDAEDRKFKGKVIIGYELVNVFETFHVILHTELGELTLRHSPDIKMLDRTMDLFGTPVITSQATFDVVLDGGESLSEVLSHATDLIDRFLRITSLVQGSWHTWVAISVYHRNESNDQFERTYLRIRYPKLKKPSDRGITNVAHASYLIQSAWNGYSAEEVKKYGYELALEWYNEANAAGVLESKFLNATTCLELMMDRFADVVGNEFLMADRKFDSLRKALETALNEWIKANDVDEDVSQSLRNNVIGLNRRSYSRKAKDMLAYWRVKYDDLGVTIRDIVETRNEITHTGGLVREDKRDKLLATYQGLMMILVRIFLSILQYKGHYYDWVRHGFIEFATVRA